jgi:hypothetical protein
MNMRISTRHILFVFLLLACVGCVAFERPPVAKFDCDPALQGRWSDKNSNAEKAIVVGPNCAMRWPEDGAGAYSMTLRTFTIDTQRYLAFSPEEADRLLDSRQGAKDLSRLSPEGSVYLARYRIENGQLNLWVPDPDTVLQGIAAGAIRGRKIDDKFAYVQGSRRQIAALLRKGDPLYGMHDDDGVLQFRRLGAETAR